MRLRDIETTKSKREPRKQRSNAGPDREARGDA